MKAMDFPVISCGLTQCLIPFAAYPNSKILNYSYNHIKILYVPSLYTTAPLGKGMQNAPLQNPYN